jgi:hypothetical protein
MTVLVTVSVLKQNCPVVLIIAPVLNIIMVNTAAHCTTNLHGVTAAYIPLCTADFQIP